MDRDAQLVSDQVLTALVPSEAGKSGLIGGARCAAVGELALAQRGKCFREGAIERKGPMPLRDFGSSMRTLYSTRTRA